MYSIEQENNIAAQSGYGTAMSFYLNERYQNLKTVFSQTDLPSEQKTTNLDLVRMIGLMCQSIPTFVIEQYAPEGKRYKSARGSIWATMQLQISQPNIESVIPTIHSSHTFRAYANILDAAVDELSGERTRVSLTRASIAGNPLAKMHQEAKQAWFSNMRQQGRKQLGDKHGLGAAARHFQMHQDAYLDLVALKDKTPLAQTHYLGKIDNLQQETPFSDIDLIFLTVMGLDAETLFVDSTAAANPKLALNTRLRNGAFWAGITGTLGDQWADILQDVKSSGYNLFANLVEKNTHTKVTGILSPKMQAAQEGDGIRFWEAQQNLRTQIKEQYPSEVSRWAGMTQLAFNQIPGEYQSVFDPVRLASWNLSPLYQASDAIQHWDLYEKTALGMEDL